MYEKYDQCKMVSQLGKTGLKQIKYTNLKFQQKMCAFNVQVWA